MNQQQFEQTWQGQWQQFADLLGLLERRGRKHHAQALQGFPALYRQVCSHYGLARSRHYSPALVDQLHQLVLRGHRQMYRSRSGGLASLTRFLLYSFPVTLRHYLRTFALALVLFYGPFLGMGLFCYLEPTGIYMVMSEHQVGQMETMYDPVERQKEQEKRTMTRNLTMFGYYIYNNISIGLRTFALGILFAVGSIMVLLYNGLTIGAVAGHLSHAPYGQTFWSFVAGHSAFELTAIVICGTAGLMLGHALVRPRGLRRRDALRIMAPQALTLVLGAMLMLVVAAAFEAYWSSSVLPAGVKYVVAALNWLLVIGYLGYVGRRAE